MESASSGPGTTMRSADRLRSSMSWRFIAVPWPLGKRFQIMSKRNGRSLLPQWHHTSRHSMGHLISQGIICLSRHIMDSLRLGMSMCLSRWHGAAFLSLISNSLTQFQTVKKFMLGFDSGSQAQMTVTGTVSSVKLPSEKPVPDARQVSFATVLLKRPSVQVL